MNTNSANTTKRPADIRKALADKAHEARSAAFHDRRKAPVCLASVAGLVVHGKSTRN